MKLNLELALRRLRKEEEDRTFWIDAICIDQHNVEERAEQVARMGEIYNRAQRVTIWLGEESDDSPAALSFISEIVDLSKFDHIVKDPKSPKLWQALSALMSRTWFTRRWVIQELALAKENALICCGDREVPWADFADAVSLFGTRHKDIAQLFKASVEYGHDVEFLGEIQALGAYQLIDALSRLFRRNEKGNILEGLVTLETLVVTLNAFRSGNPRDAIYSVLDLAEDVKVIPYGAAGLLIQLSEEDEGENDENHYPELRLDYNLSFFEVARGFTAHVIKSSSSLDIICRPWAPRARVYPWGLGANDFETLPSWITPVAESVYETRGDGHHVRKNGDAFVGVPGKPIYQASKGFPLVTFELGENPRLDSKGFPDLVRFRKDLPQEIQIKAIQMCRIKSLGERAMEGMIPSQWFHMGQWESREGRAPDSFWRTLIADRGSHGNNPPTWYRRAFEHAIKLSGSGDVNIQRLVHFGRSSMATDFLRRVQSVIWNRRFATTDRPGGFALLPASAKEDDLVFVLHGCSVPVVVRQAVGPSASEAKYELIGECYVHGIMDGLLSSLEPEVHVKQAHNKQASSNGEVDSESVNDSRIHEKRRYGIAGHKNVGGPTVSADLVQIISLV